MKRTTSNLRSIKNLLSKVFFCSQLIIISASVPVLYCVGVSHNTDSKKTESILIKTNKGGTYQKTAETKSESVVAPV